MDNHVLDIIKSRSSIRKYTDEKLTEEEILALKEAALASPTARNLQLQRFFFITNKELLDEMNITIAKTVNDGVLPENYHRALYEAPLTIVVGIDKGSRYGLIDCGIAAQSIALAAKDMGLDTVIIGMAEYALQTWLAPEADKFRKAIGMGDELEFGIAVSVGHKAADKAPHSFDMSHTIDIR